MKTLKFNPFTRVLITMLFGTLLTLLSCISKETSQYSDSQLRPKPPQIDIHTAVITDNLDAVKQHIAAGSDMNERDPFGGSSPLISAAVFGKTEIAKALIDAGVKLDLKNNDGSTALISAAYFCRPEIVRMLLEKGTDRSIKNNFGASAYESVMLPFEDVKESYDMMGKILGPMGLKLDYAYIEKTRPEIAEMLK